MEKVNKYGMVEYLKKSWGHEEILPFEISINTYPKDTCIISPGDIENKINFLVSGIVETKIVKSNGNERITEFFFPNHFFCSLSSFLTQNPTDVVMTCLTDCTIESISYDDYHKVLDKSLVANKLGREIAEQSYLLRIKREKDMLMKTASERYLDLMRNRPEIFQEIPLAKIAKYLGIDPRSLSRVRRTVFKE